MKNIKATPLGILMIIVLSTGVVFGAINWISNHQSQTVQVIPWEIKLETPTGDFTDLRVDEVAITEWPYTVNVPEQSTGFVFISYFISPSVTASVDDVDVVNVQVNGDALTLIPGSPVVEGSNVMFYYGLPESLPYDFGTTTGTIQIFWVGRSPDILTMSVRITSGLPSL